MGFCAPLQASTSRLITPTSQRGCWRATRRCQSRGAGLEDLFEKGLAQRKATVGAAYVEKNLADADEFTRPFQEAMTAWCWGFGWGDEMIEPKVRSMMNLAMIGA